MNNTYVVWSLYGQSYMTLMHFGESDRQGWSVQDYVEQAFDTEHPDLPNVIRKDGETYEVIAIFETEKEIHFIY